MRLRAVAAVLRKELTDTLRDRRTIVAMVLVPIIVYPVLLLVMGAIVSSNVERVEAETPTIALWGPVPDDVRDALVRELEPELRTRAVAPPAAPLAARRLLEAEDVDLVIVAPALRASGSAVRSSCRSTSTPATSSRSAL